MRVGADEFAAALLGKIEKIELPKPGTWVRQGQKVLSFYRDGVKTEMVSPTEGEVMEVNAEVLDNPAVLRQDPYGKGWLLSVHVPDEENTGRNLVPKGLVARVDARRRGAPLFRATRSGRGSCRRWRTSRRRPPRRPAGCQLEGNDRRVLPHRLESAVKFCYTLRLEFC